MQRERHPIIAELIELLRLAVPLAIAHAGVQLMGLVDTAVVGRLGATSLGAIGIANALFFIFSIFATGVVMGIDPLASQAFGAGDPPRARRILWQGIWLACLSGIAISVPMFVSPRILPWIGIEPAVIAEATAYLVIRTFSLIPVLLYLVLRGYLQARLKTGAIVLSITIGNVFNLVADIVLVLGGEVLPAWAGPLRQVPSLGIEGAAIASVAGSILQALILVAAVQRIKVPLEGTHHRRIVRAEFMHALRIGLPIGLQMAAEVGVFALAGLLAGRIGTEDLAAHQTVITLAATTFTFVVGIGAAASVQVGRAIGALDQARTRRAGIVGFVAGGGFMTLTAVIFILFPRELASIITDSEAVIEAAVPLFIVAAVFQISDGIQGVGAGVLRGAGDTRFIFHANLLGHWLVGFPIAILLGFHAGQGIAGIWWGLCAGLTAVAGLLLRRFLRLSSGPIAPLAPDATPDAIPGPDLR